MKKSYLVVIFAGILLYATLFSALQILKYNSFFEFSWESLAAQNNMAWNTAQGRLFYCSLTETLFKTHFEPIYLLIVPFYVLYPKIYSLFFIYSFMLALGSLPVFLITRKLFNNAKIALIFSLSYLFFNPLHNLSIATVRTDLLAITFLLFTFYFFYIEKFKLFIIFALLSLSCKEDVALIIFMFFIFAILKKREKKWKITPVLLSVFWLTSSLLFLYKITGLDYHGEFKSVFFQGGRPLEMIRGVFFSPGESFNAIFVRGNLSSFLKFFDPFLMFLGFFSPGILLLGMPMVAHILLATNDKFLDGASIHHIAFFLPFMFLAVVFSFKKFFAYLDKTNMKHQKKRLIAKLSISIFLISIILSNFGNNSLIEACPRGGYPPDDRRFLKINNIFDVKLYTMDEQDKIAWRFIALVPDWASVSASGDLLPALSGRREIYEFGTVAEIHDMSGHEKEVDCILLRKKSIYHGYDYNEVRNEIAYSKLDDYINRELYEVIEDENFILLKKKP
jgi:uncharacterized membrane protein